MFFYGGWSDDTITADVTKQKKIAFIKCKPNTRYWIVRNSSSDNFGRIGYITENEIKANMTVTPLVEISGLLSYNVTTGSNATYLLFYYTYTGLDEFIQITDYETTSLNHNSYPKLQDVIYTKDETYNKEEVIALIPQLENRKCKVKKEGNAFEIYTISKKH